MRTEMGNIWSLLERKYHIVIPVNIGWTKTKPLRNVMGRGLAFQAKTKYPGVEEWLGARHKDLYEAAGEVTQMGHRAWIVKHPDHPLVFFPTKPLNEKEPHLSWKNPADRRMIEKLLWDVEHFMEAYSIKKLALPLLGAGNGGLDSEDIEKLMKHVLRDVGGATIVKQWF